MGLQIRRVTQTKLKLLFASLAIMAVAVQPLYGFVAGKVANAAPVDPLSVALACDSNNKVVLKPTSRQANLENVPQDARNWHARIVYSTDFGKSSSQTLSKNDVDTWSVNTDKFKVDSGVVNASIDGVYTTLEDIKFFGHKIGSWDKLHVYSETLSVNYDDKNCDTTAPTIDSLRIFQDDEDISGGVTNKRQITIKWSSNDSDIDHYVYTNKNGPHDKDSSTTEFTGPMGEADGVYTYQVYAVDEAGNKGDVKSVSVTRDTTVAKVESVNISEIKTIDGVNYTSSKLNKDNSSNDLKVTITTSEPLASNSSVRLTRRGQTPKNEANITFKNSSLRSTGTPNEYVAYVNLDGQSIRTDKHLDVDLSNSVVKDLGLRFNLVDRAQNVEKSFLATTGDNATTQLSSTDMYLFTVDNVSPVVTITSPTNDATVDNSKDLTITGTVDTDPSEILDGKVFVRVKDKTNDTEEGFSTTDVADGKWSLTIPAGTLVDGSDVWFVAFAKDELKNQKTVRAEVVVSNEQQDDTTDETDNNINKPEVGGAKEPMDMMSQIDSFSGDDPADGSDDDQTAAVSIFDRSLAFNPTTTDETDSDAAALGDSTFNQPVQGEVKGAADDKSSTASFFGLAWYWWILILAALLAAIWWIAAAARKKQDA